MKRHEILFSIVKLPIEFATVFGLFFLARNVRLFTDLIPGIQLPIQTIDNWHLTNFAIVGSLMYIIGFAADGLYRVNITNSKIKEFFDIVRASFIWFFVYIAVLHLSQGYLYRVEVPRLIVFFVFIFSIFAVSLERIIINRIQNYFLFRNKLSKRNVVFVIKTPEDDVIADARAAIIYNLLGYYGTGTVKELDLLYLGSKKSLIDDIRARKIDEILFINSDYSQEDIEEIFEFARIYGVRYRYITNYFDVSKTNTELTFLHKIPFMEIKNIGLTPWGRVIKRIVDIFASGIGLVVLSPLFVIISVIIYLTDFGSPVYSHERVGKDGKLFRIYKFRSMVKNADAIKEKLMKENERQDGPLFKMENDPRITKIGKFIRKFDIDELPQLWNVFIGNMSLIGPRPHLPKEVALYKENQKRVLTIKPGITGMAQTHGRHKNTFDDEVRLDTFYIENWNLLLDVKLLFKTVAVVLGRKGA